jgi:AAA domain, putative AbiEii toxin, Type IV TA system
VFERPERFNRPYSAESEFSLGEWLHPLTVDTDLDLFRLTEVGFVAGTTPSNDGAIARVGNVTLLVGPNNSGKSLALRELASWASQSSEPPQRWPSGKVIASVDARWPATAEELESFLQRRVAPQPAEAAQHHIAIHSFPLEQSAGMPGASSGTVHVPRFRPGNDLAEFCRTKAMPHYMARLDGQSRFGLSEPRTLTSLREPPSNHLMAILRDPELHARVDAMVVAAFGMHFVVDATQPPNLQVALSDSLPPTDWHERLFADDVVDYQRRATPITEFSDGVRVFTGLVSAVQSLPHRLLLVDEPEAFLHPALVRRLGGGLAGVVRERNANLVAATHSADFLMGCVGEVPETTIVRLTYDAGVATTRILDGQTVAGLVTEPLLRAADALSALFARGAVVCEADADRAFYDEVNRRLLSADDRIGASDTVFLNAQNWQTTRTIATPLRAIGIPAAIVLDLDVLLQDGWGEFLTLAGVDGSTKSELLSERQACRQILEAMGELGRPPNTIKRCKVEGVTGLEGDARRRVERFLESLQTIGIFLVPVGELEKWLPQFGLTNKQTWVTDILIRMGTAGGPAFVQPGPGDVWNFVEAIAAWIENPLREGIPQ